MAEGLKLGDRVQIREPGWSDFVGVIVEVDTPLVLVRSDPHRVKVNPKLLLSSSRWVDERYCTRAEE